MNKFLFYFSARHFGEACLELYICRKTPQGKEQVYLLLRPANDPFYPNMLHMPGARKIPNETDQQHFNRAIKETCFKLSRQDFEYLLSTTIKAKRGTEYADVRRACVPYRVSDTDFYDIDNLPRNTIEHHKILIRMIK